MAGRTNWYVNHPPACTCARCERGRATGQRQTRTPGGRSRQSRRVGQADEGSIYGRAPRKRRGGGHGWLWAIAAAALVALLTWYGWDDIASLVTDIQDTTSSRARPVEPSAPPVAVIAPTETPTPPVRDGAAAPVATPTTTDGTQSSAGIPQAEPAQPPTLPAVRPTATPEPLAATVTPTPFTPTATPTPTAPAATPAPIAPTATATSMAAGATATSTVSATTPTPKDASTATATPTITPAPSTATATATTSPTPATAVLPSLRDFKNGAWLEQRHARLADSIRSLDWVQDGIDDTESKAIQDLLYMAVTSRSVTSSLVSLRWVQDGIGEVEAGAIDWMNNISAAEVASAVVSLGWMQDGIDSGEVTAIEELSYIANRDPDVGSSIAALGWLQEELDDTEVAAINWIGNITPAEVASSVIALGWMQDGVDAMEVTAIEELSYIANRDPEVGSSLVGLGWMQDELDETEVAAINWIGNIAAAEVALGVISLAWLQDGVEAKEITAIQELSYLSNRDAEAAQRIVLMPFLESIEPADLPALESLRVLAAYDTKMFRGIMSHGALRDGISDTLAPLVATLEGVAKTNPSLVDVLLAPNGVSLEERTITLPLAGDVTLAIIRTGQGAARSMDLLEAAVRGAEEFMGAPLPTDYVGLLFEKAVAGSFAGTNFGTHMAILPKYDVDDGSREAEFAGQGIAHEVAHYYWNGNADWIDEGAAELMAAISESGRTGSPVVATSYPCAYAGNVADLESLGAGRDSGEFRCNYSLGERVFVDLYDTLGGEVFREGFRNLYLASEVEDDTDNRRGTHVGIGHLREAFSLADDGAGAVIARWYEGSEAHDLSRLDMGAVDPSLPSINGRIAEAHVTTSSGGPPVSGFSSAEVSDWVYLTLKYSYDVSGDAREVEIDIVEYYEDGFSFRRRPSAITAEAKYIGGTSWFSVGAYPPRKWAAGRHFVYVYVGDRKVAEVVYEVTP